MFQIPPDYADTPDLEVDSLGAADQRSSGMSGKRR